MKDIKVSICVPVYNMEKYLTDCVESLVNQTLKDIEIIFVNDGSKDYSLDILEQYKQKYPEIIKIITQENTGLGGARNTGIKNAIGEYVGFVDADDFVEPDMYEKLYNMAKNEEADMVICDYNFYPNNYIKKKKWFNEYKGKIDGEFLNRNTQPWNKIVSNKLIKDNNFEFFQKNGDGVFIYLMLCAKKIVTTNEKLYNYRVGHTSMSTDYKLENFIISIDSCKKQIELLNKTKYKEELKEYFDFRMIYVLIQVIAVAAKKQNKEIFKKYTNELKKYNYKKNKYVKKILKKEFKPIKYFGIIHIMPINYNLTKILTKIIL